MTKWRPIETAPRNETEVLLLVNGAPVIGFYTTAKEWPSSEKRFNGWTTGMQTIGGYDCGFARIGEPTHWMPLPPRPRS